MKLLRAEGKVPLETNQMFLEFCMGQRETGRSGGNVKLERCVCVRAPVHAHPFSHSVVSDSLRPHGLTVPHQSPLSMAFSRQEYWIGLPFPTPGNLPKPGMEAETLASSALAGKFFTTVPPGKPISLLYLPLM